jgi:plastocyanin
MRFRLIPLLCCLFLASQIVPAKDPSVSLSARVKLPSARHHTEYPNPENVVVWLSPNATGAPSRGFPGAPFRLVQHNKSFEPHVLVIPVGAVVEFPNHDPFFHNVFSLFEGKRFDLGLYEAGTSKRVRFDRVGISYIFCNIHAEMSAAVIALDTPYYAISDRKGEIVIPDVPTGRYTMHVWYETALPENLSALTKEVTVNSGSSTLGIVEIPAVPNAAAHKNKYGLDYEPPSPGTSGYEDR